MTTTNTTKLQQLAADFSARFHVLRDDEGKPRIEDGVQMVATNDPEARELAREVHGTMLPDSWRYSFIVEALDRIAEYDDLDVAANEIDADVYTSDRLAWLSSRLDRARYVDEAIEEYGVTIVLRKGRGIIEAIAYGQIAERREVFELVRAWIEERAEEDED